MYYSSKISTFEQHLSNISPSQAGLAVTGENLENPVHSKPSLEIYGNPRGGAARAPCIDFLPAVIGTVCADRDQNSSESKWQPSLQPISVDPTVARRKKRNFLGYMWIQDPIY
jgi:hypothetical protein